MTDNEPWWFMWPPDEDNLYCEDGQKRPLTASDYVIGFGKYKGLTIAEVTDEGYLRWMKQEIGEKKGDWLLLKCLSLK